MGKSTLGVDLETSDGIEMSLEEETDRKNWSWGDQMGFLRKLERARIRGAGYL